MQCKKNQDGEVSRLEYLKEIGLKNQPIYLNDICFNLFLCVLF